MLDEWLSPLRLYVQDLMEKAEDSGVSDEDFLSLIEREVETLHDRQLTNSDALVDALWGLQTDAFREGWEWYDRKEEVAGGKCRAKDPQKCRFHGKVGQTGDARSLGLEKLSDIKPDPASSHSNPERGMRALRKGFEASDINGDRVIFDKGILDHWMQDVPPKSKGEITRRMYRLSEAVRSVKKPHEIWELPNGQKTYLRVYIDKDGSFAMSGFITGNTGEVRTFFHSRRLNGIEKMRKGTLKYKR